MGLELERWIEESRDQGRELEPPDLAARKGATRPGADPNASASPPAQPKR